MTTESKAFFDKTAHLVTDGNIVYATDLNNPLTALETGQTALINALQTGETIFTATDTGAVNAYAINPAAALTAYSDGQTVWLKPGNTNTGASTINVSSLGAKNIRTTVRTSLVGGELIAGYWAQLKYSSTLDAFVIVSERGKTDTETEKTIAGGAGIDVASTDDTITVSIEAGGVDTTQLADEAVTQEKISPSVSIGPKAIQVFSAAGAHTYTPTPGATVAVAEVIGGGGEGANTNSYASGGGGGGGYSRKRISLTGISSVAVTVGAGGSGGTTTGGNGGSSSFGAHCSATGGTGSVSTGSAYPVGGVGGSGSGGDINIDGSKGATGGIIGGVGGSSIFGGSGQSGTIDGASTAGSAPGAGGAGGAQNTGTGGDGADGIVIVTEY